MLLPDTLYEIRLAGTTIRHLSARTCCWRTRPPVQGDWAWLRERGIATTMPEVDDQIAHRRSDPAAVQLREFPETLIRGHVVRDTDGHVGPPCRRTCLASAGSHG